MQVETIQQIEENLRQILFYGGLEEDPKGSYEYVKRIRARANSSRQYEQYSWFMADAICDKIEREGRL